MNMPPLIVKNNISISAPASKVWDALVNPEQTKKYMFGCEAISDWKIGSPLIWRGLYEGKEMIFVKGNIVDLKPGNFLAYTVIDPNSGIADIPENYLDVTYALLEENGKTIGESIAEIEKCIELTEFATSLPQLVTGEVLEVSRGVECRSAAVAQLRR